MERSQCRAPAPRPLATLRLIPHLQPPVGASRIWLERFSPYFTDAEASGIENVRPDRAYPHVYPVALTLERIAYFFKYDAPRTLPDEAHRPLWEYIAWWQAACTAPRRPYLGYLRGPGRLTVMDARQPDAPNVRVFDEAAARIARTRAAELARASSSTRASSQLVPSVVPGGGAAVTSTRARASAKAARWTSARAWCGPARASHFPRGA